MDARNKANLSARKQESNEREKLLLGVWEVWVGARGERARSKSKTRTAKNDGPSCATSRREQSEIRGRLSSSSSRAAASAEGAAGVNLGLKFFVVDVVPHDVSIKSQI